MNSLKLVRLLSLTTVLASLPVLFAVSSFAQTPSPTPNSAPAQVKPVAPADAGSLNDAAPSRTADPGDKSPGATAATVAVGAAVFGSDGQKLGEVKGIKAGANGRIEEIHVKTGGILGFGGKTVAIPGDKVAKGGEQVQIAMTSDEISKLPAMPNSKG